MMVNVPPPTKSQARVLAFIEAYIREHGESPTRREIKVALGLRASPDVTLRALVDLGKIHLVHEHRGIRLGPPGLAKCEHCPHRLSTELLEQLGVDADRFATAIANACKRVRKAKNGQ